VGQYGCAERPRKGRPRGEREGNTGEGEKKAGEQGIPQPEVGASQDECRARTALRPSEADQEDGAPDR